MAEIPAPPPGFQIVPQSGGGIPPPPAGFELVAPKVGSRTFERDEDEALYRAELARQIEARSKPRVPLSGYQEGTPEEEAAKIVEQQRGKEAEQASFDESRTPLKRITDASTFALSSIPRALTGGRHGLGDVAGLVSEEAGQVYNQAEADFARANRGWLEPAAKVGSAAIGIPMLQSLGAVPGQMLRTSTAAVRPSAIRAIPGANRLLPSRSSAPPAPPRTATPAQAYGPAQRIIDRQAFVDEGIPEFAPAFGSKGLARTGRTIEEVPLVGGTVKTPKLGVEQAMAQRQSQIAQQSGAAASAEDVGLISQRGLDRFRTAGLEDLDSQTVGRLGILPNQPQGRPQGMLTVDRPSRLNTAAMTDQQLTSASHSSNINLPGSSRTRVEHLTPREVQRIINLPARDTSFATKAAALYKQADDSVANQMRANNTVNPGRVGLRNLRNVVSGIVDHERRSSISGGVLEGRFGALVTRALNQNSHMSLADLRAARTEVGRALSNFGQYDVRLDRTQLKQFYGALSDDYQAGLVALAARARRAARDGQIPASVADQADRALHRYRVADRYYRNGIERMDRFMNVLGADTLEQASKRIASYLRENTQNIRSLESMASSLRPEEWRSVLGNVIEGLGRLTPGAREAERVFSFERFATDWNKISQNPRVVALFRRSLGNETVRSLENMGRIAERMKYYETTKNYSGTAYTAGAGAGMAALLVPQSWPLLIAGIAGPGIVGKVITSRPFARWVNSLNRAQVRVGSSVAATRQAVQPHLQRLGRIATTERDPEVAAALSALAVTIDRQLEESTRQ